MDRYLSENLNQKLVQEDFNLYPVALKEVDNADFSLGESSSSELSSDEENQANEVAGEIQQDPLSGTQELLLNGAHSDMSTSNNSMWSGIHNKIKVKKIHDSRSIFAR